MLCDLFYVLVFNTFVFVYLILIGLDLKYCFDLFVLLHVLALCYCVLGLVFGFGLGAFFWVMVCRWFGVLVTCGICILVDEYIVDECLQILRILIVVLCLFAHEFVVCFEFWVICVFTIVFQVFMI